MPGARSAIAVVVKGYPRLSETFIAQEIQGLERRGLRLTVVSLRHPTDPAVHELHRQIAAPVIYLPEYLYQEPGRVLAAWRRVRRWPTYPAARRLWLRDVRRDRSPNRARRFGQALVLAAELPQDVGLLYAHYLHTPASVTRYAAALSGRRGASRRTPRTSGPRPPGSSVRSSRTAAGRRPARPATPRICGRSRRTPR